MTVLFINFIVADIMLTVVCLMLAAIGGCLADSNYTLYYASQGWMHGQDYMKGGLYGGDADPGYNGNAFDLTSVRVECFLSAPHQIKEDNLRTRGISFDKLDNEVLFHLYDQRRMLVFSFPRCQNHTYEELCDPEKVEYTSHLL